MLMPLKESILAAASRSPTVHNVQPFSVKVSEQIIEVYDNPRLILSVADAEAADHEVSLGALLESISLALSEKDLKIARVEDLRSSVGDGQRLRLRVQVSNGGSKDSLQDYLLQRKCFRGVYPALKAEEKSQLLSKLASLPSVKILGEGKSLAEWGKRYDNAAYEFLSQPKYLEELYGWMRFDKGHARYETDGLNAEAMSLPPTLAALAKFFLQAPVFRIMKVLGLGKALISEAPQIKSALAMVVVFVPRGTSQLAKGRALMRAWLELTKLGLFVAPLSSLIDSSKSRAEIEATLEGAEAVMVMRVGKVAAADVYRSPRKNLERF